MVHQDHRARGEVPERILEREAHDEARDPEPREQRGHVRAQMRERHEEIDSDHHPGSGPDEDLSRQLAHALLGVSQQPGDRAPGCRSEHPEEQHDRDEHSEAGDQYRSVALRPACEGFARLFEQAPGHLDIEHVGRDLTCRLNQQLAVPGGRKPDDVHHVAGDSQAGGDGVPSLHRHANRGLERRVPR